MDKEDEKQEIAETPAAETLADILAEMRGLRGFSVPFTPERAIWLSDFRSYADRIEAAAKYEIHAREQAAADYALKRGEQIHADRCRNCSARALGNAAPAPAEDA
jgi:mono/diheme cytochrome c family protein